MTMKVSELEGAALDAAVAKAEGIEGLVEKDGRMCRVQEWDPEGMSWRDSLKDWVMWIDYAPSQRWDHGGPIIERESIAVYLGRHVTHKDWPFGSRKWIAGFNLEAENGHVYDEYDQDSASISLDHRQAGETPLIAAMRAYVASRFGEEVDTKTE
jgi:hypothetical protein